MRRTLFLTALLLALSGCGRNMYDQAKFEPYDASPFYEDGTTARPLIEGTVSRSRGEIDEVFFTGQNESGLVTEVPLEVTEAVLQRGQERYNIYCSPCHNYSGNGEGMIVQNGFVQPASFHDPRLQSAPVGYFFQVITNGFGRMYPYASRIPPEDRWAISAYIRSLQYSQSAPVAELPADVREQLVQAARGRAAEAARLAREAAQASSAAAQAARDAAEAVQDTAQPAELSPEDAPEGGTP
jgi:mono/diheme cytochrome c family protein